MEDLVFLNFPAINNLFNYALTFSFDVLFLIFKLAKMYAKYQEAVDALRHEQLGRKQSQAILERVLYWLLLMCLFF